MMKTCTKCKIEKQNTDFYKNSNFKDGLIYYCKKCFSLYQKYGKKYKEYQQSDKRKEYLKKYYQSDKRKEYLKSDKRKATIKKYQQSDKYKEYKKEYLKKYYQSDKRKATIKKYQQSDKCKEYQKEYRQLNQEWLSHMAYQKRILSPNIYKTWLQQEQARRKNNS